MTPLQQEIFDRVNDYDHVSFAELEKHLQSKGYDISGSLDLLSSIDPNILIWPAISQEFSEAFQGLADGNKIALVTCDVLVYMVDGKMLTLPLAPTNPHVPQKHLTWRPCVIRPASRLPKDMK